MIGPGPSPLRTALGAARVHFGFAAVFSAVINLLYVAPTIYMLQVYDRVIPSRGVSTLLFLSVLLVGSLGTLSVLELLRTRLLVRASARLNRELAGSILATNLSRGGAPMAMRDFDTLRQAITGPGVVALFDAPWTLVYVGLCFVLHPILGAMAFAGCATLALLSLATERAIVEPIARASIEAAGSYASQSRAAPLVDLICSLGMRPAIMTGQLAERAGAVRLQAQASFTAARYQSATRFVRLSLQSLGLGTAAWLAVEQQLSAGAIFAASLLMSRALAPLEMVLGSWRSLTEARNAYGRLEGKLVSAPDAALTQLPPPTGQLTVEQVWVAGPIADRPLLGGVSFDVRPGEVLGVVGPSGAGKSTLGRALVGALRPERGHVRLDHASLSDWDQDRLGQYIGYLPQELGLLQGTVKQNICRFANLLPGDAELIDAKVVAAARACGAHEMILRLKAGYDTLLDWGGVGLSLGQAQRIALARALYGDPHLVVLDEPNAHLDGEGEACLLQALSALKARGAAVVLVAHRATMLAVMDSLLVLNDGRVTRHGPKDEVLSQLNGAPTGRPQELPSSREAA